MHTCNGGMAHTGLIGTFPFLQYIVDMSINLYMFVHLLNLVFFHFPSLAKSCLRI